MCPLGGTQTILSGRSNVSVGNCSDCRGYFMGGAYTVFEHVDPGHFYWVGYMDEYRLCTRGQHSELQQIQNISQRSLKSIRF